MAAAAAPLPPAARAPPGGVAGRAVEAAAAAPGAAAAAEPGEAARAEGAEGLFVVLGAGLAAASHPLLYVKLLVQVGHEPLPPTVGRNVLGRKVLYLPGFFTYARHIVEVDGKRGLFRGLTPRLISSTLSTITRGSVKKAFPLEDMEHVSNKDDVKTSLRKVVKETSHEMMMQCVSRVVSHPLHVISMRCMVQFVGREVKYSGVFSAIGRIFKEEGILGFFVGLVPRILGDVIFLWCCNLLAHFINTYAVDDNPGIGDPELHKIRDGDRCEHADVPVPSRGRSHGSEQLWVACRPPSLRSRVYILDPLLEVSQCSGAAVPRLQPALPQSAHASRLLPRRLTPRQGAVMNSDSSRNPKLVSIRVYFFFSIRSPWCQSKTPPLQQGQQQVGFWRFGFRLQLDQSSILMAVSSRTCSREHRRVLSCLFGPGCSSGVTGEVWETRKCPGTKRASPEMQGQKTASFCLS